jgi:hypothetical protein
MKNKLLLLSVFFAILFASWFFTPWSNVATDLSYDFEPIANGFPKPWLWRDNLIGHGLGLYAINTLWSYPLQIIFQYALQFGIPFSFQMKYMAMLPILIVGTFGMYKLAKVYNSDWVVGSLFYFANSYFLLLIDGGQLHLGLAYALLPLCFYLFLIALNNGLTEKLFFGLSVWLLGVFDIRIVWLLGCIIGIHFLFHIRALKNYLSTGVVGGFLLSLLNMYWILPSFLSKSVALPAGFGSSSQLSFLGFTSVVHSLFLQQPHWYLNSFGNVSEPLWYFSLFPIVAFASLILSKEKKKMLFLATVALIAVFLAKGSQAPWGNVYVWLFATIPGFNMFRDSTKFFFLVALSYATLSGITFHLLIKRNLFRKNIAYIFLIVCLLILSSPILLGKMTGTFSRPLYQTEHKAVQQILSNDSSYGRVVWIPVKSPLGYHSLHHLSVDAFRLLEQRPFAIGVVGSYELFNFFRDAPFIDQIMKVTGIKYVAYPYPDERREELNEDSRKYYDTFLSQLTHASWSDGRITEKPVPFVKAKESQEHMFLALNHYFVLGSDRLYWDLADVPEFDLSKNALTFLEEKTESTDMSPFPDTKIILYKKNSVDLALRQIPSDTFVFPAKQLGFEPNESGLPASNAGWWKRETSDLIRWRSFLQEKYALDNVDFDYGGGWAVGETGSEKFKVKSEKFEKGKILFARVMKSTRSGSIEFSQGTTKIGALNTKEDLPEYITLTVGGYEETPDTNLEYEDTDFSWLAVGTLVDDGEVTIETKGDINVVNVLAVLSEDEFIAYSESVDQMENEGKILYWDTLTEQEKETLFYSNAEGKVSYERVNPTQYTIKVEGITRPQTLVFSENYDSLWQLNNQSAIPLYSMLNGFRVDENGEYALYFSAQKYVLPGLVVSLVTLSGIGILLFVLRKKYNKKNEK